ncbi:3-ketoacyl-CoA synthase 7 [Salvia hispanica]|uniref:3-ketoacyl-CoA synthase 7 n=1 Tax=Salvia hispanica TaxID=49212 RepID=UPI0020099BF5|nr:3-ketoacyl-CoA synthase 7 [Salvia hispanica]
MSITSADTSWANNISPVAAFSEYGVAIAIAIALLLLVYFFSSSKTRPIYLIDSCCYLPPPNLRATASNYIEHFEVCGAHEREGIDFQTKMIKRSGIGCEACLPISVHQIPPDKSLSCTQEETETVLFTVVKELLSKQSINPKSIDILVTNCSIFCPTPSITAMIINKFGLRSNIKSVSLSGMGCSAGLVAIGLAKDLLRVQGNSLALVLSMEAVTPSGYDGSIRSMLLANTLFRMGGAAVLLSNKKQDRLRAKYKLRYLLRTHMGSDDQSYHSVIQKEDGAGSVEQLLYGWSVVQNAATKREVYVPNFKKAFEHFCIHAGGKAIIDAVEERLRLKKEDGEASRMTLHRFGNTSSSSVWYELSYLEAKGRIRKGDRVWQIAFGSGFKCNSAVWECISELDHNIQNAWSSSIHMYPIQIPDVIDH